MPGRKIFSAEKDLINRIESKSLNGSLTLHDINQHVIDLKSDIKSIAKILSQRNDCNDTVINAEKSLASELEQIIVDKKAFEKQKAEFDNLKIELKEISDAIEKTKNDIAELAPIARAKDDGIDAVTSELDSITDATEKAADEILEMTENIEAVVASIKAENTNSHLGQQADEIIHFTTAIFEACNFQDLTGQRITKSIKTLNFVSERINHIIEVWGSKDLIEAKEAPLIGIREDCGVTISGPAAVGEGIGQDDIDKLFD
ncbi:MAG: hypothetical protein AB7U85_08485 [Alphaproteobacteria bacterium]